VSKALRQPALRVGYQKRFEGRAIKLGAVGLQPRATFHVDLGSGLPLAAVDFVVDSGATISSIGLEYAANLDIPVPPPEAETALNLTTATGSQAVRVRPGRIRLWWHPDRTGYHFDWPILFRPGLSLTVPPLLGLGGVVSTCVWTFDGRYDPDSPFGYVLLDDCR